MSNLHPCIVTDARDRLATYGGRAFASYYGSSNCTHLLPTSETIVFLFKLSNAIL